MNTIKIIHSNFKEFIRDDGIILLHDTYPPSDKYKTPNYCWDAYRIIEDLKKDKSIENIIAENYTFQNLNQLNKAYKDWLNIDVRKILYKKKRVGNSVSFLESRISDIIQYRHGIVHHFSIDRSLTKEGYIHILEAIEKGINEFIFFIERKYGFKVDEHC